MKQKQLVSWVDKTFKFFIFVVYYFGFPEKEIKIYLSHEKKSIIYSRFTASFTALTIYRFIIKYLKFREKIQFVKKYFLILID